MLFVPEVFRVASPSWSSSQYLRFEDERTRPARDLLNAVPRKVVARAADLGCGPGNSTELLVERFPGAKIVGVDSSEDMLDRARDRLPELLFINADLAQWNAAEPQDLIFANAVMQWVPDHPAIFPHLLGQLQPGGTLAIQMPDNLDEPSHVAMREVAQDARWHDRVGAADASRTSLETASFYYQLLKPLCQYVDIWRTVYHHPLHGAKSVVDWFKGSGLRPYLDALAPEQQGEFLSEYERQIFERYATGADGTIFLPFPRLFIVATR